MIRVRNAVEVALVALVTVSINQVIVTVDMAGAAWLGLVRSGQRKLCGGVIKRRRRPCILRVAGLAVFGEVIRCMIRIGRVVIIRSVALVAIAVSQLVVATNVAIQAWRRSVCALEREFCQVMIVQSRAPSILGMAEQAIMAELERGVVRVRRVIDRGLVALPALAVSKVVIAVGVTVLARHRLVGSLKRKIRCSMTERGWTP